MRHHEATRYERPRTNRVPLLLWLGIFIALTVIGATAIHLVRHPPVPPINHCPPHESGNPWCIAS